MKSETMMISLITTIIVLVLGISYAYFQIKINNENGNVNIGAKTLGLEVENSVVNPSNLKPVLDKNVSTSEDVFKHIFTIKRTSRSNLEGCYSLNLVIDSIGDNLKSKWVKYRVTDGKTTVEGAFEGKVTGNSVNLLNNQTLEEGVSEYNYTLTIWMSYDTEEDQTEILTGIDESRQLKAHLEATGTVGSCPKN